MESPGERPETRPFPRVGGGAEPVNRIIPVPINEERPWVVFAACADVVTDIFFNPDPVDERAALALCATCPVRDECLDYALEARERYGVWGGTTEKERRRLVRRSA
jgi:WhiB family redox-sensing transcriptional regulator